MIASEISVRGLRFQKVSIDFKVLKMLIFIYFEVSYGKIALLILSLSYQKIINYTPITH